MYIKKLNKYNMLLNKALEMGYKNVADAMKDEEFRNFKNSIKNKSYKF